MYMCVGVCDSGTDGELVGVRTCTHVSLLQMHAFVIMDNDMAPAIKYHCNSAREV